MKNFYFTYGSSPFYPFCGGWTKVKAENEEEAIKIFNKKHPACSGFKQYISCYSEEDFKKTLIFRQGSNRGAGEQEVLSRIEDPDVDNMEGLA